MKRIDPDSGAYRVIRKIALSPYKIGKESRFFTIVYIVQQYRYYFHFGKCVWHDVRFATRKEYKRFRKAASFEQPWVTEYVYGKEVRV